MTACCTDTASMVHPRLGSTGPLREASLRKLRGPGGAGHRSGRWVLLCAPATVEGRLAHPAGPTASRATRTHARSTIFDLRAIRPVRVQARAWSPKASTSPPQPGGPQRLAHKGSGRRRLRRRAKSIACGGSAQAGSLGMAVNQAPACGPDCDRRRAQAEGDREGSSVRSRK